MMYRIIENPRKYLEIDKVGPNQTAISADLPESSLGQAREKVRFPKL